MRALVLSTVLLVASPGFAADAGKPSDTKAQPVPKPGAVAPPVQGGAVKPLTQPTVVAPAGTQVSPKVEPPALTGTSSVSAPKVSPTAPAAGPAAPNIPAAGGLVIDPKLGSTIRDANQLDAIRDLQQLERLFGNPMQRGAPAGEGQADGLPQTLGRGRVGAPPGYQDEGPQRYGPDCLNHPQDCIPGPGGTGDGSTLGRTRDGAGSGNAADRMGGPPTHGGILGNPGAEASGESTPFFRNLMQGMGRPTTSTEYVMTRPGDRAGTQSYERGEITTARTRGDNGNVYDDMRASSRDGAEYYRHQITRPDGHTMVITAEKNKDGTGTFHVVTRDAEGRIVSEQHGVLGSSAGGGVAGTGGGPAPSDSQPREDPSAGSGRNDGCGWAPLHGCLNPREDIRTTIRRWTTQPGINPDGEGTEGGTGASRGGNTGPAAVTNTGDGSFGTERGGSSSQGTPIWQTMPDPARGGPGGPATGGPARRAGSAAGLDASMGALPLPPPR